VNEPVEIADADLDDELRAAVFRHQMGNNASGQQNEVQVFCLAVEGERDPSAALLARFARTVASAGTAGARVVAASACDASGAGVHAKDDGASGIVLRIEQITVDENDAEHALVEGGYYEAGLSASGNTYELRRTDGQWRVVGDVMHWIS
jgi:hypothetical protein